MNGYVCLGINTRCDIRSPPTPVDALVGLNYDLDPTRNGSGQIYFQLLNSDSFYFKAAQTYFNILNGDFFPTHIFMITYDEVLHNDRSKSSIASFQIFLSADSATARSYVLFYYMSCPFDTDLWTMSGLNFKSENLNPTVYENKK